ncbi:shikimate kinase [Gracilibacillus alcaliphilus]|uniref:shikimate kinase n=1 Tax=Gracilibacillus alcaliphilus TaxID=1401441 RepID=UPI001956D806|nr:shikimate kinase [Gracilibacillus alcaliphilus]MBM7675041.1 shikimate kinase [Gracilibacillus alcaliphilus]
MKSLYLVGFMGSGKTSVAAELHHKLGWLVEDMDALIEQAYQTTIPEVFKEKGEETFRQYETEILKQTTKENTIVSTGGGVIQKEYNRNWLKTHGKVIYLSTSWEEIKRRLVDDENRPIWNNQDRDKESLLVSRLPYYIEVADIIVETDGKTTEQIATEIISHLHE